MKRKKIADFDLEVLDNLVNRGMAHAMQTQHYRSCKRLSQKGYCWQLGNSREFHVTDKGREAWLNLTKASPAAAQPQE